MPGDPAEHSGAQFALRVFDRLRGLRCTGHHPGVLFQHFEPMDPVPWAKSGEGWTIKSRCQREEECR